VTVTLAVSTNLSCKSTSVSRFLFLNKLNCIRFFRPRLFSFPPTAFDPWTRFASYTMPSRAWCCFNDIYDSCLTQKKEQNFTPKILFFYFFLNVHHFVNFYPKSIILVYPVETLFLNKKILIGTVSDDYYYLEFFRFWHHVFVAEVFLPAYFIGIPLTNRHEKIFNYRQNIINIT